MKKLLFPLVALLFTFGITQAQENGAQLAKNARLALALYREDQTDRKHKLEEAKQIIDQALQTPEAQALVLAWQTKGEIYSTIDKEDRAQKSVNPEAKMSGDNDALEAYKGYAKALELATKEFEKSDALKGLFTLQSGLIENGILKLEAKEYFKAYESSLAAVKCHDLLVANVQKSAIPDTDLADRIYFAGYCAMLANRYLEALRAFQDIPQRGYEIKEKVYEAMVICKTELGDDAGARAVLAEGRRKYPENSSLLFTQINLYLKENRLDELTGILKKAIKKEPSNASLYISLGQVYDGLQQREGAAQNTEKAQEYFNLAVENYSEAARIDPGAIDAHYQLGLLFYNKAALSTQEMAAISNTEQERYQEL
jgi:tetratricopeptide (TPR) repeat protein